MASVKRVNLSAGVGPHEPFEGDYVADGLIHTGVTEPTREQVGQVLTYIHTANGGRSAMSGRYADTLIPIPGTPEAWSGRTYRIPGGLRWAPDYCASMPTLLTRHFPDVPREWWKVNRITDVYADEERAAKQAGQDLRDAAKDAAAAAAPAPEVAPVVMPAQAPPAPPVAPAPPAPPVAPAPPVPVPAQAVAPAPPAPAADPVAALVAAGMSQEQAQAIVAAGIIPQQ